MSEPEVFHTFLDEDSVAEEVSMTTEPIASLRAVWYGSAHNKGRPILFMKAMPAPTVAELSVDCSPVFSRPFLEELLAEQDFIK